MNEWTEISIEYANQRSYLDDLFRVYPTIPEGVRDIDKVLWAKIEKAFERQNDIELLNNLLKLNLFPVKDSYVAYLKRDKTSLKKNPATVKRLCGRLYEMDLSQLFVRCSEPKETNRQIGPLFKRWLNKKALGIKPVPAEVFFSSTDNAVLDAGDNEMMTLAKTHFNYKRDKGLDFVGRFNGKYVLGEAKFLTDFGGHQNAQFNDALATLHSPRVKAIMIAILDGVLYIKGRNKMYKTITSSKSNLPILSSLVLRDFLFQL